MSKLVKTLIFEEDADWVFIEPKRYLELMKLASYFSPGISNLPQYRGKKIAISGNLNLSNTPTKSLDGVKLIQGNLDISKTEISSLEGISVKGWISKWDTPLYKIEQRRIKQKKLDDAEERRQNQEWEITEEYSWENEDSYVANAIVDYVSRTQDVNELDFETKNRLSELKKVLSDLEEKKEQYETEGLDTSEIEDDIQATEDEIEEINEDTIDVYNLIPDGDYYGLSTFEIIGNDNVEGQRYCGGVEDKFERAAYTYVRERVREGYSNFNQSFVESHIDEDEVAEYFREHYETDVRDNPEIYFDERDYQMTEEQESRIEELERQIKELEEKQNNLENEIEEPSDYSDAYDEIQEQIDELESEKEDIENEEGELTEDMIDEKVEELLDDVKRDPIRYLKDMGFEQFDQFINENEFINAVLNADGLGIISTYDSDYDIMNVNGQQIYVTRLE